MCLSVVLNVTEKDLCETAILSVNEEKVLFFYRSKCSDLLV